MKNFMLDLIFWMIGATICYYGIDDKQLCMLAFGLYVSIYKPLIYGV